MCRGPTGSALGLPECLKPPERSPLRPRPAAEAARFVLTHRMAPAGTRPEGPGDRVEGEAGCGSAGWSLPLPWLRSLVLVSDFVMVGKDSPTPFP